MKNNQRRFRQSPAVATMKPQQAKGHSHIFRDRSACGSQIIRNNNLNPCKLKFRGLLKQIDHDSQIPSVTKKPIHVLRLQGLACDLVETQ